MHKCTLQYIVLNAVGMSIYCCMYCGSEYEVQRMSYGSNTVAGNSDYDHLEGVRIINVCKTEMTYQEVIWDAPGNQRLPCARSRVEL